MAERIAVRSLPSGTRSIYVLSQVLAHLLVPVLALAVALRSRKEPGHLRNLSHRFGLGPVGPEGAVWIYAASLGETRAASPLIRRLRAAGYRVTLTHQSPAGLAEGWRLFPDDPGITHRYMPLDLFWAVRLFLRRARPVMGIVLEIEIWPAMLLEARRAGVPMVMANGNLLERSMGGMKGPRKHLMRLYREFAHIFTRTPEYRDRYLRVGVDPARISVVGELKYDQWIDPEQPAMGLRLRRRWRVERVLMIASSVKDEESILLPMVQRLLTQDSGLGVLWVPRSPQRFDPVTGAMAATGMHVARRSSLGREMAGPLPEGARILIGDSIGEMNAYYAMADLVFVGASLVDHGGHNIMEPMALGRPVVMGPSTYGIAFTAGPAAQAGALETLPDVGSLENRIAALLADTASLARMSANARAFTADQTGAADRTIARLLPLLHPQSD